MDSKPKFIRFSNKSTKGSPYDVLAISFGDNREWLVEVNVDKVLTKYSVIWGCWHDGSLYNEAKDNVRVLEPTPDLIRQFRRSIKAAKECGSDKLPTAKERKEVYHLCLETNNGNK